MPLPPDEAFMSGGGLSVGVDLGPIGINFYRNWYGNRVDPDNFFVFVGNGHLVDRDYRRFVVPAAQRKVIINRTRTVTKFEVVNNRVVNRGVDVKIVEKAAGRKIEPVSAKAIVKPNAIITTVDEGKQVRERERAQHPVNVEAFKKGLAPVGTGANPDADKSAGSGPGENSGGKPNGNGAAGNGPASTGGPNGAMGGSSNNPTETDKGKRRHNEETTPPSGPGAGGAGQSDENTTTAPTETPKKRGS